MEKYWKKMDTGQYALWLNNREIATMHTQTSGFKRITTITANGHTYQLKPTGWWKSNTEVRDENGLLVAEIKPETWYGSSYLFNYNNNHYKLQVRNNPMSEWVLHENNQEVLAYGLKTKNGKACVGISGPGSNNSLLPEVLLWYLFQPIATENIGQDDMLMTLLLH